MEGKGIRQTVLASLSAVGAQRESQFYADLFKSQDPERFALIVIDPRCLKNPLLESLIGNIRLLSNLGLTPILLVGALDEDRTSVKFQAQRLSKDLDHASVRTTKLNTATYGLIPEIRSKVKTGLIPILEMTERRGNMNLSNLVRDINPNKVIFLQPSGGLSTDGRRVRNLTIDKISSYLECESDISAGQRRFLTFAAELDAEDPQKRAFIIASPLNLLSELFTTKGSGTLIKRRAEIIKKKTFRGFNKARVSRSISAAFGKDLSKDFFKTTPTSVYLEANYLGGAIFQTVEGMNYLSKFWVCKEAQGDGLAKDIWDEFVVDIPSFFWRSRLTNSFNVWYMERCDGMQVVDEWRIFWKGFSPENVSTAIQYATQIKVDFKES